MATENTSAPSLDEAATVVQEAIKQLDEYEAFVDAKEAVEADERVQEHRERVETLRRECLRARQDGTLSDEQLAELREARDDLQQLDAVQEYHQAEDALTTELEGLNEQISADLALNFGDAVGTCCRE